MFPYVIPDNPANIQVYELHRVYKIQRDLMKQYQNKDIYAYPMLEDASKMNSPSQLPPNGAKMSWPIQTPPMSITYKKASIAEHGVMNHPLKFLREGSVQSSPNGFPPSDVALNARQGTFDLQLSADHYVDDDNASDNGPIDFLGVAPDKKPQNNADLTLVSPEGLGRFSDNSSTSGLHATNNVGGRQVVDLNEPITGTYMGRANGSVSRGLSYTLENSWHQSILKPSTANFNYNKEYSKEKHLDEGTSSNFFAANAKTKQEEKQLIDKGNDMHYANLFIHGQMSHFYVWTIKILIPYLPDLFYWKQICVHGMGSLWNLGRNDPQKAEGQKYYHLFYKDVDTRVTRFQRPCNYGQYSTTISTFF